ncbi:leucyl aminopeptidase [Promineifilum sp.]|uniref:leucyl aminopeptidase n=1 Tax=Promineifilum sp. TaxID=2664178 RepID=UPI0035B4DC50
MDVNVEQGSIEASGADTLIVNLFEGVTAPAGATGAVDNALGGAISDLIAGGDLKGKAGEVAVLYPRGAIPARRVLVVGLGKADSFDLEGVRRASAAGVKRARDLNARHVATIVHGAGFGGLDVAAAAQATVEGALLAAYRFDAPKKKEPANEIEALTIVEYDNRRVGAISAAARVAEAVAAGVALARDLVNMPPNVATPTRLAEAARTIAAAHGLGITVGDRAWAAERKMGAYLAVAQGAGEPPQFIILEHNVDRTDAPTVVLVGKGITFDTGGISIKPSERMGEMKSDMGGAAAVLGAMEAVGRLNLPLRVIAITPCTENMPDANAYRPADIITASNGKTIEIISTDAEGRMVLADALVHAAQYQPDAVIDLATLTGACVVALGSGVAAGIFCNDDGLRDRLLRAADATYERLWPLPLYDDYRRAIKSEVADMKNSGGRFGGVGTSAVFLKEFTDYPWAHLDIAGVALAEKSGDYTPVGGTGFGVRLLVDYLRGLAAGRQSK